MIEMAMFDSLERTSQTLFPHTPKRAGRPPPPQHQYSHTIQSAIFTSSES
ncbi:Uncharacterized protein APZ42_028145 [Daphnia magna]|uniref:Uncharacterized protein n=1 Tax=Daphnia magna TaxID=35525 RepID=A0A164QSN6_9CRUS|nr:Uncharacterized protein APZ42_028145 [Daphnia magna]